MGGPAQSEGARRLLAASGESDRADERLWTGIAKRNRRTFEFDWRSSATPQQVADTLAEYYALGVTTFSCAASIRSKTLHRLWPRTDSRATRAHARRALRWPRERSRDDRPFTRIHGLTKHAFAGQHVSTLQRHAPLRNSGSMTCRRARISPPSAVIGGSGLPSRFVSLRATASIELAGHITARDPEWTDHFWVNPFGKHFSRIRVSDLLLVNAQGEIVVGDGPVNQAAFAIHAAIHEARPDVIAAAHTHSLYGKAWSTLGRTLDPLTQDSCAFYWRTTRCSTIFAASCSIPAKARASRRRLRHAEGGDPQEPRHSHGRSERRGGRGGAHRAR